MNLTLLFASPLLVIIAGALVVRFRILRKPFRRKGWAMTALLAAVAFLLPLAQGVWLPDLLGVTKTFASAKSSDGHAFRVEQRWNYCDFYTTAFYSTTPDGRETEVILDGDSTKIWHAGLSLKESQRLVTISSEGRTWSNHW